MRGSTTGVSNEEILRASHDYALRGRLRGRRPSCRGCGGRLTLERVRNDQRICGPCSEEIGGAESYKDRVHEYTGYGRKDLAAGVELGEMRREAKVYMSELSEVLGVSQGTLSSWLLGKNRMPSQAYDDVLRHLQNRMDTSGERERVYAYGLKEARERVGLTRYAAARVLQIPRQKLKFYEILSTKMARAEYEDAMRTLERQVTESAA